MDKDVAPKVGIGDEVVPVATGSEGGGEEEVDLRRLMRRLLRLRWPTESISVGDSKNDALSGREVRNEILPYPATRNLSFSVTYENTWLITVSGK